MKGYPAHSGLTRARLLRGAFASGVAVAGGAAVAARSGGGASFAAPAKAAAETEILNVFLLLECVQEDFYRAAIEGGRLDDELLRFADVAGKQETKHVAFLRDRLGSRADERPRPSFGDALSSAERFRDTAIDLEEAAIAVYIGQGANLTRDTVGPVATLLATEARQAAWIRDLAGVSPAPRAADPAGKADEVLADLRNRGFIA